MSAPVIDRLQTPASVLRALEERTMRPRENDSRQFPRRDVVANVIIEYTHPLPGNPRSLERHRVLLVDISKRGLRFLHSEQLFPGERARVQVAEDKLIHLGVARCRKIGESCYEIGGEFVTPNA